ncbi:MAG: lysine--tRNA ligase [Thermoleophilaceae bacterium]|nr:lysine--tRNA ligase [Thermoleophilaceae bacterium]
MRPEAEQGDQDAGQDAPRGTSDRRIKLGALRAAGVDPFPHSYSDVVPVAAVRDEHEALEDGAETDSSYRLGGRLAARRGHGKAAFLDLVDRSGRIQLHARADILGEESHSRLLSLDLGDLIGIEGTAFKSRRGELSLRVDEWTLLAKSLRAPPEKFHGLEDVETRYRRRELDLIANEDTRELFILRSRVVSAIRRWLDGRGFLEVETPVLQPLYGGALAEPFTTHHNALDSDFYLRIATELYLKRLIVGGLEKVYELGKDFRNEGLSHKHNPEFTMLEWYEAYADYSVMAAELEELVSFVASEVSYSGPLDFGAPWKRVTLTAAIKEGTGVDIAAARDRSALLAAAAAAGISLPPDDTWPALVDELLSKHVEPEIVNPTFILDYPKELSPFAKDHRSEEGLVERFECFAGGMEFANAFSELNDPDEQRARFEQQRTYGEEGDAEAQPYDEDFVTALEHGMPPTGGIGVGIDRLVMLLSGRESIREVVLFPAMRPRSP